jgi:hypothetical protein
MTNEQNTQPFPEPAGEYRVGQRSITRRGGPTRFEMVEEKKRRSLRSRPFIIAGIVLLMALLVVPTVAFVNTYVLPPRKLAIKVGEYEYSRGDVVDLIRFNQRLSEELGVPFQLGSSTFDALQTIQDAELSFQVAPKYGVTVDPAEVDERIGYILGYVAQTTAERQTAEFQVSVDEAKRQFLNRVGLPESVWREFLRKVLFQERLRDFVSETVPRIQLQAHVYEIILSQNDPLVVQQIQRELSAGRPTEDVVIEFSEDFDVRRSRGDQGWIPNGMVPEINAYLFGLNQDGARVLPLRTASAARFISETGAWSVVIVDEIQEARELGADAFETMTDRAFVRFLNAERLELTKQDPSYLYLDLNSEINSWINSEVQLAQLLGSPTPSSQLPQGLEGQLPQGLTIPGGDGRVVPTPSGLPGLTSPVN